MKMYENEHFHRAIIRRMRSILKHTRYVKNDEARMKFLCVMNINGPYQAYHT